MSRLFSTAISSMTSTALGIDVIGNNIANVNTNGFKSSAPSFGTLLSQTLREARHTASGTGQDPMQVGTGVELSGISTNYTQGALAQTGNPMDMAVDGRGFFVLSGPGGQQAFTRDGQFSVDSNGRVIQTTSGMVLQGLVPDANGVVNSGTIPQDIVVPTGLTLSATATANVEVGGNLNSKAAIGDTAQLQSTYYDSLGANHTATVTFTKTAAGAWSFAATADSGTTPPTTVSIGNGTLSFDADGKLTGSTGTTLSVPAGSVGLSPGATGPQPMALKVSSLTQMASGSQVQATYQDGMAPGTLVEVTTSTTGAVQAIFSNGQTKTLAQVALATFANRNGLSKLADNVYVASSNAGTPQISGSGMAGAGRVVGQSLERSNTDLASELTSLIVLQRGYQASTRLVSTADEMLQDALRLKQ